MDYANVVVLFVCFVKVICLLKLLLMKCELTYRKSGNFHVEIIHVVNIQCRFIFVGLWYPRKYFNINLFQHEHLAITIVNVLLISRMNISL